MDKYRRTFSARSSIGRGTWSWRGLLRAEEVAEIREAFMEQSKDGPVPGLSRNIPWVTVRTIRSPVIPA
jgi:hypothetical protein